MKKLIFALIAVLLIAVMLVPNVAVAQLSDDAERNDLLYLFMKQMCALNGANDKEGARECIKTEFNYMFNGVAYVEEQRFSFGDKDYVNLVAKMEGSNTSKQVIIGAHYDTVDVGEGASDNVSGLAAMYLMIEWFTILYKDEIPCNVVFVAFDGEEDGLVGSKYFVSQMSQSEIDNTLVMFNIDSIASGDNFYLMCENKRTDLATLILSNTRSNLQEKPYAKGVFGNLYDVYGYGYYETVQGSDHTPFRLAGIPTALFFSGTYSATVWNYAESKDSNNAVINTSRDTFEHMLEFEHRIYSTAYAVVDTVLSDNFMTVAENARSQLVNLNFWYNSWWPIIAAAVIVAILIVLAVVYYRKLQKNAILGESEIKTQKVFDKPKAEDIFSFEPEKANTHSSASTTDSKGSNEVEGGSVDDIFTFKK